MNRLLSNCCGANDICDGNLDNNEGVCADCGEHCEFETNDEAIERIGSDE